MQYGEILTITRVVKTEDKKRSRGQSKKQAEERERFSQRIEEKEQRLR